MSNQEAVATIRQHTIPGTALHALMDDESFDELRGAIVTVCNAAVRSLADDPQAVERSGDELEAATGMRTHPDIMQRVLRAAEGGTDT